MRECRSVREICVDVGLIRRGDSELPELPLGSVHRTVPLLQHLVRLCCGTTGAARRMDADRRFTELVDRLYRDLVAGEDLNVVRTAERCRDGMSSLAFVHRNQQTN